VLYLGKKNIMQQRKSCGEGKMMLNPCLKSAVSRFRFGQVWIPPRIGCENPVLMSRDRGFLRHFVDPVLRSELSREDVRRVAEYRRLLFCAEFS
jgi:hypothetical protein